MENARKTVFPLVCAVQKYAWGKIGEDSEVAQLCNNSDENFKIETKTPYAELWMGTHARGPSQISPQCKDMGVDTLQEYISQNPACLGDKVNKTFNGQLPFLFKVLSINKALSIQAHPNKENAEILHMANPENYPDDNHKPELAIALTPFEALCGFRPLGKICQFLKENPELAETIGKENSEKLLDAQNDSQHGELMLSECFKALMNCSPAVVQSQLSKLVHRLNDSEIKSEANELLLRAYDWFPGDVGCFCVYFLNYMKLNPGEAIFLEANLPHAYLSGDCIECMACSDNVVRAGLTPKFKDVSTLCRLLNYQSKPAVDNLFPWKHDKHQDPHVQIFNPPIPDFAVAKIEIPIGEMQYEISSIESASILLVVKGSANTIECGSNPAIKLMKGTVIFVSANEALPLVCNNTSEPCVLFRAYCHFFFVLMLIVWFGSSEASSCQSKYGTQYKESCSCNTNPSCNSHSTSMCSLFGKVSELSCECGALCQVEDVALGTREICQTLPSNCSFQCVHAETCCNKKIYRLKSCAPGFEFRVETGSCYKLFNENQTLGNGYMGAWTTCQHAGAYLVNIETAAENNIVKDFLSSATGSNCLNTDICIIVDESGSVGETNFNTFVVPLIHNLVGLFDIGPTKTQIAIAKFNSAANPLPIPFNLNTYSSTAAAQAAITVASMAYSGGGTDIAAALAFMRTTCFNATYGARPGVAQVGILITDGFSNVPAATAEANMLHALGVELFVIGVGSGTNLPLLNAVASAPDSDHVFNITQFSMLDTQFALNLQNMVCSGSLWIGLTDFQNPPTFIWSQTGADTTTYSAWAMGHPPAIKGANQCCTAATLQNNSTAWQVVECSLQLPVLCETRPHCYISPASSCNTKPLGCKY